MTASRTSAKRKAKELAKYLRTERPDYDYLKNVFRHLREELEIEISRMPKKLPYVPTQDELRRYYDAVWHAKNFQDMLIVKTLLYTGARVSELVNIRIRDVDFEQCQIRILQGEGKKDRVVPFPPGFKETLAMHAETVKRKGAVYLFESSWKKKYTDRGVRKILQKYSALAGMESSISPHKLRHFLFTWLKKQGIDDALIQPYSGHASRQSLEIYSKLAIPEAQEEYNRIMHEFPI